MMKAYWGLGFEASEVDPKPQEGSRWCETPEGADVYGLTVREGLLMKKAWFTEWIWEGREEGKIENCEGESWKERKKEARNDNGKEPWMKRGKKERWSEGGKIDKKMHSSVLCLWGGRALWDVYKSLPVSGYVNTCSSACMCLPMLIFFRLGAKIHKKS